LNYLTERINIRLDEIFPGAHFRIGISFYSNIVSFTSNIRQQVNGLIYDPKIKFKHGCEVLFNIPKNINPATGQERKYRINRGHTTNLRKVYNLHPLYFHASFSDNLYGYVYKVNESYHKLVKKYPLLYNNFEVWFTIDGEKRYLHQKWIHLF
jgi:hypothetical protein